jgi:hypothetical protein
VQRFGNNLVERYLETQKKATEESFTETPKNEEQTQ